MRFGFVLLVGLGLAVGSFAQESDPDQPAPIVSRVIVNRAVLQHLESGVFDEASLALLQRLADANIRLSASDVVYVGVTRDFDLVIEAPFPDLKGEISTTLDSLSSVSLAEARRGGLFVRAFSGDEIYEFERPVPLSERSSGALSFRVAPREPWRVESASEPQEPQPRSSGPRVALIDNGISPGSRAGSVTVAHWSVMEANSTPDSGTRVALDDGRAFELLAGPEADPDGSELPVTQNPPHGTVCATALLEAAGKPPASSEAPWVRLIDYNVFGAQSATSDRVAAAILHASTVGQADLVSIGFSCPLTSNLRAALIEAEAAGVVVVVAAGDDREDLRYARGELLATHPGVLSVMAVDSLDRPASFTNYGRHVIGLAALGVDVPLSPFGRLGEFSGTSIAASVAAGELARRYLERYGGGERDGSPEFLDHCRDLLEPREEGTLPCRAGISLSKAGRISPWPWDATPTEHLYWDRPFHRRVSSSTELTSDLFSTTLGRFEVRAGSSLGYDENVVRLDDRAPGRNSSPFRQLDLELRYRNHRVESLGHHCGFTKRLEFVDTDQVSAARTQSFELRPFWYYRTDRRRFGIELEAGLFRESDSTREHALRALPFLSQQLGPITLIGYGRFTWTNDHEEFGMKPLDGDGSSQAGGLSAALSWGPLRFYLGAEGERVDTRGNEYDVSAFTGFFGGELHFNRSWFLSWDSSLVLSDFDDPSIFGGRGVQNERALVTTMAVNWLVPWAGDYDELLVSWNVDFDYVNSNVPLYDADASWATFVRFEYRFGLGHKAGASPRSERGALGHGQWGNRIRDRRPPKTVLAGR